MSVLPPPWSNPPAGVPGTSFENPLFDFHAQRNRTSTRYYVLDPSQGIIQTTQAAALQYITNGMALLTASGFRIVPKGGGGWGFQRHNAYSQDDAENAVLRMNDRGWEFISVKTALAEAALDSTIYYDIDVKYFRKRVPDFPELTEEDIFNASFFANDGTFDTGATSTSEPTVATS